MEKEKLVHSDIRPNNLMIKIDKDGQPIPNDKGDVCLKIIDFDRGGKSGEVYYPLERNNSIFWPAGPGEAIVVGHDRELVGEWFDQLFDTV
ncbi:hypothetical protein FRC03_005451 [Tulasnella sp. 419]|nr:hypothetical protein FRC03_005451 [Tulasnella sp. 419]